MNKFHKEILAEIKKHAGKAPRHFNLSSYLGTRSTHYFVSNPVKKKIVLKKVFVFPKDTPGLPQSPNFLLVENNCCFGVTSNTAIKDLKTAFPEGKIIYAADHMAYSYYRKIKGAGAVFYGRLTNECRGLTPKQCRKKGIQNISYLFPWEGLVEEWLTVQAKQFPYQDLRAVRQASKTKAVIDL